MRKTCLFALTIAIVLSAGAVSAQEKQSKPDDQKHTFRLETDSGRYGLTTDKLDPKQLGVAIYPGAKISEDGNNDGKGASIAFDWGKDSARLYVQKYTTTDPAEKVLSFYRKELSKYGPVVECRDGKAVGTASSELKCEGKDDKGIELKAGTEQKQHIVGVTPKESGTEFGVVYLDKSKRGEI